jgi:hypothetical protein
MILICHREHIHLFSRTSEIMLSIAKQPELIEKIPTFTMLEFLSFVD